MKKSNTPRKSYKSNKSDQPIGIRLNRFVANAGICSRRDADELISSGKIKVNGEVVTEMGIKVMPGDSVEYKGKRINSERKVYILMNKPKDVVTTTSDPEGRTTVMEIIKNACTERVFPVGRLDRSTTGVLLITNDGDMTKKLTHPSHKQKKIYQVSLNRPLTKSDMLKISEGFELDDGFIAADVISYIDDNKSEIGIEIHSGRNRIVRRMFEHLDYDIRKLDRVYFAGLTKKNLPRGKWRFLTDKEVAFLKIQLGKNKD
jgi:23S rRNA pseudouridine2605 synthase